MSGRIAGTSAGWRSVKLGDVCDLVNGDAYRESDWSTSGVPIIRIQNLNNHAKPFNYWPGDLYNRVVVNSGDVLLAWSGTPGTSFGTHMWERGLAVLNQHIFRVDLDKSRLDSRYSVFAINEQLDAMIDRAHGAVGLRHVTRGKVESLEIQLPPLDEQRRIAAQLRERLAAVSQARAAVEAHSTGYHALKGAILRASVAGRSARTLSVRECLCEVIEGIGADWRDLPVLGATRAGLAPAKEPVGKQPHRYKPVRRGNIFYNPMRILLGSIAMVDEHDEEGITSPDYVVMRGIEGVLHPVWFYHWLRSSYGAEFIKSLTRGAVRERLLFNRLAKGDVPVPDWEHQLAAVAAFREIKIAERAVTARLAQVDKLPAALLRAAFVSNP